MSWSGGVDRGIICKHVLTRGGPEAPVENLDFSSSEMPGNAFKIIKQ